VVKLSPGPLAEKLPVHAGSSIASLNLGVLGSEIVEQLEGGDDKSGGQLCFPSEFELLDRDKSLDMAGSSTLTPLEAVVVLES
jgi:hypothetical protein